MEWWICFPPVLQQIETFKDEKHRRKKCLVWNAFRLGFVLHWKRNDKETQLSVIPAPYPVRDKLQPESRVNIKAIQSNRHMSRICETEHPARLRTHLQPVPRFGRDGPVSRLAPGLTGFGRDDELPHSPKAGGYTFIELTVVMVLLGLILSLAAPSVRSAFLTDELKSTTRKMAGTIKAMRSQAMEEQKTFSLHLEMESNRVWCGSDAMTEAEQAEAREKAVLLPKGIQILDVWFRWRGKQSTGEATIPFNRKGYARPSAIHIGADDGRRFTLVLSPFTGRVQVFDRYVDFEDNG
jgi:Tfp pilus assembly protein FimT